MNYPFRLILFLLFPSLLAGCSSYVKFLVCPPELSNQIKAENDLGRQREVLVDSDYRIVAVSKDKNGEIALVQHYRPEHTFTNNIHPLKVTWGEPLRISSIVIIEKQQTDYGIAIQKSKKHPWQVYWFRGEKAITKNWGDGDDIGVLFLPPMDQLTFIKN